MVRTRVLPFEDSQETRTATMAERVLRGDGVDIHEREVGLMENIGQTLGRVRAENRRLEVRSGLQEARIAELQVEVAGLKRKNRTFTEVLDHVFTAFRAGEEVTSDGMVSDEVMETFGDEWKGSHGYFTQEAYDSMGRWFREEMKQSDKRRAAMDRRNKKRHLARQQNAAVLTLAGAQAANGDGGKAPPAAEGA